MKGTILAALVAAILSGCVVAPSPVYYPTVGVYYAPTPIYGTIWFGGHRHW